MKIPKDLKQQGNVRDRGCSIRECSERAMRNLPEQEWKSAVKLAKLSYDENKRKRIYLCRDHYYQVKKHKTRTKKNGTNKKGFLANSPKPTNMRF